MAVSPLLRSSRPIAFVVEGWVKNRQFLSGVPIKHFVTNHRLKSTSHFSAIRTVQVYRKGVLNMSVRCAGSGKKKSESDSHKSLIATKLEAAAAEEKDSTGSRELVQSEAEDLIKRPVFDRNFITAVRAMSDFCLKPEHIDGLRVTLRRSPNERDPPIHVYWRKDVEAKAIQVWGSLEALEAEQQRLQEQEAEQTEFHNIFKLFLTSARKQRQQQRQLSRESWPVRGLRLQSEDQGLGSESGRVVLAAIAINSANCAAKLVAWIVTGSYSMFSEAIHSAADTLNQVILAIGIKKSMQKPTETHPYGYANLQYVSSLISGVGIFCLGAGLSIYHGVTGLLSPSELESIWTAVFVLGGSFVSESVTLALAVKSIRNSARARDMSFMEFVVGGYDPCVNVVLLEDFAAVVGVVIAAVAMGVSVHTHSHIPDAVGSIAIGGILASVASFMIYTNARALVGRSIPEEKLQGINKALEGDIMIRQIHDVKGIDMGNGLIRYKAEVDFDGRELTRYYLQKQTIPTLLEEAQNLQTTVDYELFMLKHGEALVDCLGEQVDRIERDLKEQHPDIRHVDLEVL